MAGLDIEELKRILKSRWSQIASLSASLSGGFEGIKGESHIEGGCSENTLEYRQCRGIPSYRTRQTGEWIRVVGNDAIVPMPDLRTLFDGESLYMEIWREGECRATRMPAGRYRISEAIPHAWLLDAQERRGALTSLQSSDIRGVTALGFELVSRFDFMGPQGISRETWWFAEDTGLPLRTEVSTTCGDMAINSMILNYNMKEVEYGSSAEELFRYIPPDGVSVVELDLKGHEGDRA